MRRTALTMILAFAAVPAQAQTSSMEALDARIGTAQTELERLTAERQRVEAEIDGLARERGAAQRRLRSRVHALYRMRRAGLLPLAGGFDALLRHQSRAERLERMVGRDVAALRTLSQRVAALSDETARLAGDAERRDRELAELRERRAALERAHAEAFARATAYENVRPLDHPPSLGLVPLRGQLPLPVSGSVRLQDAEREGGVGIELLAPAGLAVRAVAAGRVAYAAPHPAYGRLVIVDHGEGFYTVYGGLGALTAPVGQAVEPGAPLGTSAGQPVFFQVRQGTRPLAAREWLGLDR